MVLAKELKLDDPTPNHCIFKFSTDELLRKAISELLPNVYTNLVNVSHCSASAGNRAYPGKGIFWGVMRAIRGILFTCDAAVKQILLTMNEKDSFIIEDLDDHHLVIKADEEYRVRKELETELEKNTYSLET